MGSAAGFIQSAISPTVLVTGMLELQRQNYGSDKSKHSRPALAAFRIWPGIAQLKVPATALPEAKLHIDFRNTFDCILRINLLEHHDSNQNMCCEANMVFTVTRARLACLFHHARGWCRVSISWHEAPANLLDCLSGVRVRVREDCTCCGGTNHPGGVLHIKMVSIRRLLHQL